MEDFYDLVEHAIDKAFEQEDYSFNCYDYLTHNNHINWWSPFGWPPFFV